MPFKLALCPNCGGKMQIPDDADTTICMECGVETVGVSPDTGNLSGKVKEFTEAVAINKGGLPHEYETFEHFATHSFLVRKGLLSSKWQPLEIKQYRDQTFLRVVIAGVAALLLAVFARDLVISVSVLLFYIALSIFYFRSRRNSWNGTVNEMRRMYQERWMRLEEDIVGCEGLCPYCNTQITLKFEFSGQNCPACQNLILIRNSKFYSVEEQVQ